MEYGSQGWEHLHLLPTKHLHAGYAAADASGAFPLCWSVGAGVLGAAVVLLVGSDVPNVERNGEVEADRLVATMAGAAVGVVENDDDDDNVAAAHDVQAVSCGCGREADELTAAMAIEAMAVVDDSATVAAVDNAEAASCGARCCPRRSSSTPPLPRPPPAGDCAA